MIDNQHKRRIIKIGSLKAKKLISEVSRYHKFTNCTMNSQFRLTSKFSFSAYTNLILEILFYFDYMHLSIISDSYNREKNNKFHGFRELRDSTMLEDKNQYFYENS